MTRDELIDTVASRCYLDPDQILSAIRAIEAAGMKIVERKETSEMILARERAWYGSMDPCQLWRVQFDAAPKFGDG